MDIKIDGPTDLEWKTAHSFDEMVDNSGKPAIFQTENKELETKSLDILETRLAEDPTVDLDKFDHVRDLIDLADSEAGRKRIAERLDELTSLNIELEGLALIDPMTGLPNRRHLDERLKSEIDRARREGEDLAVGMLDVNNFKVGVNDGYGHVVGDKILKIVGQAMHKVIRGSDFAARYGGDEFSLILPSLGDLDDFFGNDEGLTKDGGNSIFFRINAAIEDLIVEYIGTHQLPIGFEWNPGAKVGNVPMFISAGIAFLEQAEDIVDESLSKSDKLLYLADVALYKFKRMNGMGRDNEAKS